MPILTYARWHDGLSLFIKQELRLRLVRVARAAASARGGPQLTLHSFASSASCRPNNCAAQRRYLRRLAQSATPAAAEDKCHTHRRQRISRSRPRAEDVPPTLAERQSAERRHAKKYGSPHVGAAVYYKETGCEAYASSVGSKSLKASRILSVTCDLMLRSSERIMFLIASGVDFPWPIITGAFTPSTGVPPTFS